MSKALRNLIILTVCIGMVCFTTSCYDGKDNSITTTQVFETSNLSSEFGNSEEINQSPQVSINDEFEPEASILTDSSDETATISEETQSYDEATTPFQEETQSCDETTVTVQEETQLYDDTGSIVSEEIQSFDDTSSTASEGSQSYDEAESTSATNEFSEYTQSSSLPEIVQDMINSKQETYPGMIVSAGIYSLDGTESYEYNPYTYISSGCTVKAPYAMYVLQTCELQGIDIYNYSIEYQYGMKNGGSGTIQYSDYGTEYTISELLTLLLGISDNTAYNILLSEFPLTDFQNFLDNIGGQQLDGARFGATNVIARKNEWFAIWNYINSDSEYSYALQDYLTGTDYCYLVQGMDYEHKFLHKSGWSDGSSYTCACDCAILDDQYLIIVMTEDYTTGEGHVNVLSSIGWAIEQAFLT